MTAPGPWSPLPPSPPPPPPPGGWWSPTPPAPPKPPRDGAPWAIVAIVAVAAAVLGGAVGGLIVHGHESDSGSPTRVTLGSNGTAQRVVNRAPDSVAAVAAKIVPSVVSIEVKVGSGGDTGSGIVLS